MLRCPCHWLIFYCNTRVPHFHYNCHNCSRPHPLPHPAELSKLNGTSILCMHNGQRGNGLNSGSRKVKCRHRRQRQSQRSIVNQRGIIRDFQTQHLNSLIIKLEVPSCALAISYHHYLILSSFCFLLLLVFPPFPCIQSGHFSHPACVFLAFMM